MTELNEQQAALLEYLKGYYHAPRRKLPSLRQIGKNFGWTSTATPRHHLRKLVEAGVLKKNKSGGLVLP